MASLKDEIAGSLPQGFNCKVRYVRSNPKSCDPLFSPPAGFEPEKTRLANHFLTVSIDQAQTLANEKVYTLVLGIEALVYSTKYLTTIFVSKADSTGYLPQQRPSPSKAIVTTFLKWLVNEERRRHPSRTVVVSLFARAQSQYLFPGSAENSGKHVLDDRQLVKWWARVLDPIFPDFPENDEASTCGAYITVPGYERGELRQFMPPGNNKPGGQARWKAGNPLTELAEIRRIPAGAPPRSLLPIFPDDPKARFMQDLDGEVGISDDKTTASPSKRHGGKWKTIRHLDRFWEAMEFRQECSSGRLVGFLWVIMRPTDPILDDQAVNGGSQDSNTALQSDPTSRQGEDKPMIKTPTKRRRKPLSGPIIPRQPRLKSASSSLTGTSDLKAMLDTEITGGLVLSKDGYDKAMQTLLHLDFAATETAAASTHKWVTEVSGIAGLQAGADWSLHISGTAQTEPQPVAGAANSSAGAAVNDLGGMIRKKRKAEDNSSSQSIDQSPVVNIIRKKPKAN